MPPDCLDLIAVGQVWCRLLTGCPLPTKASHLSPIRAMQLSRTFEGLEQRASIATETWSLLVGASLVAQID